MGHRGPPPEPTRLKLLKGNPGKRALNDAEPQPPAKAPPCPPELSDLAKKEWRRISRLLLELGLLTEIDRAALAGYCDAYATWIKSGEELQRTPLVIIYKGLPMQSPYVAIHNAAGKQMLQYLQQFGLSPSSRSRVRVDKPEAADELDEILARGRKRGRRSA
jgi:P27 family predicted phage terminase small subunit